MANRAIVSFGLITDIHYADLDDRWNYAQTFLRRYRNSLNFVGDACRTWCNENPSLAFVIQLGDLIDGFSRTNKTSEKDLQTIRQQFEEIEKICPIYHLWGNHEFYNFTREQLLNGPLCSFDTRKISPSHYGSLHVCDQLTLIALDTYEFSVLGLEPTDEAFVQAMNYLRKHNPNENTKDPTGLNGHEQRFIQLNGGLKRKQLEWLRDELVRANDRSEKVMIVGHIPIHPNACDELALLWNYDEVLNLLWSFENLVVAYVAGHSHEGAFFRDQKNIHHLTLHAVVESEPSSNAFATVHVYENFLIIQGYGRIDTYRIDFLSSIEKKE